LPGCSGSHTEQFGSLLAVTSTSASFGWNPSTDSVSDPTQLYYNLYVNGIFVRNSLGGPYYYGETGWVRTGGAPHTPCAGADPASWHRQRARRAQHANDPHHDNNRTVRTIEARVTPRRFDGRSRSAGG
jgi:hypothetical protein